MWFKEFADYPIDTPLIKEPVEPGKGIIGCEMHERNGWGNTFYWEPTPKKRKGRFWTFFDYYFEGK